MANNMKSLSADMIQQVRFPNWLNSSHVSFLGTSQQVGQQRIKIFFPFPLPGLQYSKCQPFNL